MRASERMGTTTELLMILEKAGTEIGKHTTHISEGVTAMIPFHTVPREPADRLSWLCCHTKFLEIGALTEFYRAGDMSPREAAGRAGMHKRETQLLIARNKANLVMLHEILKGYKAFSDEGALRKGTWCKITGPIIIGTAKGKIAKKTSLPAEEGFTRIEMWTHKDGEIWDVLTFREWVYNDINAWHRMKVWLYSSPFKEVPGMISVLLHLHRTNSIKRYKALGEVSP